MFTLDVDRLPRLDHAKDLERQADALDGQAASAAKAGLVDQRQAEQQPQEGEAAAGDGHSPPRRKPA
jgi:hypothetical protein